MRTRSPITTHILDLHRGKPATGVSVTLEILSESQQWSELAKGVTDADGRIENLLEPGSKAEPGSYRLSFDVRTSFYPCIVIQFQIDDPRQHYHVPLLLSDYGYSTYRGS